jgi:hypothetical protein
MTDKPFIAGTHRLPPLPARPGAPAPAGVGKIGVRGVPLAAPAQLSMPPLPMPPVRVTPPVLPPARPGAAAPGNHWQRAAGPSAGMVQKQYVELRLKELVAEAGAAKAAALVQIEQLLLEKLPPAQQQQKIPAKELQRVYAAIERNLQAADLTINFDAVSWFREENTYDTYTQMYERAVQGGRMKLATNAFNDPVDRARNDNRISFPTNWSNGQAPATHRGNLAPGQNMRPGAQSGDRIRTQMDTGNLNRTAPGAKTFEASNAHFNPKTKQIFMGLNYGRRPHGSAVDYGASFFVMKGELKNTCFYYGGDTILQGGGSGNANTLQVPYTQLASIIGKSQPGDFVLRPAIFQSCYEGRRLPDPDGPHVKFLLLEGHYFGELAFRKHVDHMILSPKLHIEAGTYSQDLWATVVQNATTFAKRHGFKVYQTT